MELIIKMLRDKRDEIGGWIEGERERIAHERSRLDNREAFLADEVTFHGQLSELVERLEAEASA